MQRKNWKYKKIGKKTRKKTTQKELNCDKANPIDAMKNFILFHIHHTPHRHKHIPIKNRKWIKMLLYNMPLNFVSLYKLIKSGDYKVNGWIGIIEINKADSIIYIVF